jgi:hypothetical protein
MATEFTFGAGNERISIRIETAKASLDENPSYKNRLESTVNLQIGAFSGAFKAEFTTEELMVLHQQLIRGIASHLGTLLFRNAGGDVSLSIVFNGAEAAVITGTILPHRMAHASLTFRLDMPETALARTAEELEDVLHEFPYQPTDVAPL